jgi:hypothetical protein
MSAAKLGDNAHPREAPVKTAIDHMNTERRPKRSASQPAAGNDADTATR